MLVISTVFTKIQLTKIQLTHTAYATVALLHSTALCLQGVCSESYVGNHTMSDSGLADSVQLLHITPSRALLGVTCAK